MALSYHVLIFEESFHTIRINVLDLLRQWGEALILYTLVNE